MCRFNLLSELKEWERTRNIEFSLYNVQYNGMSGKKLFKNIRKPRDLYGLPIDNEVIIKKPPREESEKAVNMMKEWLKKT